MYRFIGTGVVWDKERNKALCEFDRQTCTYETDDLREIGILKEIGFDFEEFEPEATKTIPIDISVAGRVTEKPEPETELAANDEHNPFEDMTKAELAHFAEQQGIELYEKATKAQMVVAITVALGDEA